MSAPGHDTVDKRGHSGRPGWARAEHSCGDFISKLPGGKSVWIATGPAAKVWRETLSPQIRSLLGHRFHQAGVSLFLYMVGRQKSTSSPTIIFCSSDVNARKEIRSAVQQSGILKDYPAVRLGDSSSPLARGDSGLYRHTPRPAVPQSSSREGQSRDVVVDREPSVQAGPALARLPPLQHYDVSLRRRLGSMTLDSPSSFSLDTSADGASTSSSIGSRSRRRDWTPMSSVNFAFSASEARYETPTLKYPGKDFLGKDFSGRPPRSDSSSEFDTGDSSSTESGSLYPAVAREMDPIFDRLFRAYCSYRQQTIPAGDQGAWNAQSGGPQASGLHGDPSQCQGAGEGASQVSKGKRRLADDDGVPATALKKSKEAHRRGMLLACPFWKRNPSTYSRCHKFGFKEVRRVKQHLYRNHTRSITCPRCQDTFPDQAACNNHLRDVDCARNPPVLDEGIDDAQMVQLSRKGRRDLTQEQRWYVVWGIVFRGAEEPDTPYIDGDLSEDMSEFLEFYRRNGATIVLDHMRTSADWSHGDEQRFRDMEWRSILDQALQGILHRFYTHRHGDGSGQSEAEGSGDDGSPDVGLDSSPSPGPDAANDANDDNAGDAFGGQYILPEEYVWSLAYEDNDGRDPGHAA